MVKNQGGNKGKKGARKHLAPAATSRAVRERTEDGEIYAAVLKLFGGAICEVICEDGHKRTCVIRNKFRGRGKRDNFIGPGVWVLVGKRDWEARAADKQEKCDLLYVYRDDEKKKLLSNASVNWAALAAADPDQCGSKGDAHGEEFAFYDASEEASESLVKSLEEVLATGGGATNKGGGTAQWDDIIDIDDI